MTKAAVNSIFAVRCIVFAFSMILFGKLIDKHRPEKVVFFGGLITVIGLVLTAYSETKVALSKRNRMSNRRPAFKRQNWFRYKRLGDKWRRPRGIHSKMRRHFKYRITVVQ